jgi:phosphatidylcholine synthase
MTKILCWAVHLYTALGLACAAGMAYCIVSGGANDFRWAFILMGIALFIDASDGTLARAVHIKDVLPGFDGRRLDDIIDFQTYTSLPLLLIWRAGLVSAGWEWTLVFAAIASIYGFCQVKAKTDDGYFLGFPSYWNLVAFYLYLLPGPGWVAVATILGLALLTFVPTRYLYPSQPGKLNMITNGLGAIWGIMLVWIVVVMPADVRPGVEVFWLGLASLFFPIHYMVASWVVQLKIQWRGQIPQSKEPPHGAD